jgi:histone H3/H4
MTIQKRPILPISTLINLMKNKTNFRVSENAGIELSNHLENLSQKIIKKADLLVLNKNKKTIQKEDIDLANNLIK